VSESSVKASLQQLFEKTGVRTRSQLVRVALEHYKNQKEPVLERSGLTGRKGTRNYSLNKNRFVSGHGFIRGFEVVTVLASDPLLEP